MSREHFEEAPIRVGRDPWRLPGILTLPARPSAMGVVLVPGSGPIDRDGSVGALRPLRDLAHGLASLGIATLRYDRRTWHYGAEYARLADFTVDDEITDDAIEAIAVLRAHPALRLRHVCIVGHSFGAAVAPRIATRDGHIAGVVLMAAPSRPVPELWIEQIEYLASRSLWITAGTAARVKREAQIVLDDDLLATMPAASRLLGFPPAYWRHLRGYDAVDAASNLPIPILLLHAGRDYHVTARDLDGWRSALVHRHDVTFKIYPEANHLFVFGTGPSLPVEYKRDGTVATAVVHDIAAWLAALI